jgi:pimeloyl-ACP methyl ester carboxylesterase
VVLAAAWPPVTVVAAEPPVAATAPVPLASATAGAVPSALVTATEGATVARLPAAVPADGPPCLGDGPSAAPRLPGLRYQCLVLPDGTAVLLAEAAAAPEAPVVLLVHGLGQNAHRDWAPTFTALAGAYRVLAVDLPGFGGSPPQGRAYSFAALDQTLAQVLDLQAPGRAVHVVGHSLGGALALHFAHRQPQRVASLVLVDAAGILLKPVFVREMARAVAPRLGVAPVDRLLGFLEERFNGFQSMLLLGRDDRYDFLPWLMRQPELRLALLGGLVQVDAALGLVEHDFSAALREVRAPTTVLWGEHDRVAPGRTGLVLARRLPQARLQVVPGAGHTPMLEQPAAFHRLLLAALANPTPVPAEPAPLRALLPPPGPSQGHVRCQGQSGQRYSGRFDSLTLQDCGRVQVENAWLGRLVLRNSTASLVDSVVAAEGRAEPAVDALDSELTATASRLQAAVALRSENSFFDLAGVSLRASGPVLDLRGPGNRLFLSVSDWQGSDLRGDAHVIWPRP